MAFLAADALHFINRQPQDPGLLQSLADFFQLEWLYDGFDAIHERFIEVRRARPGGKSGIVCRRRLRLPMSRVTSPGSRMPPA